MKLYPRDIQARVNALGHVAKPLIMDGQIGPATRAGIDRSLDIEGGNRVEDLFDPSGLHRVHGHWTGGTYGVIDFERHRYNVLIEKDGMPVMGRFAIEAQAKYAVGRAASHTLNANTGAIGVAIDAMHGAKESPFSRGPAPITWHQVVGYVSIHASICMSYQIPVTKWSVLTHAEVQPTLGIPQNRKWDINWLPDMDRPGDPVEVGNRLREMIRAEMGLIPNRTLEDYIPSAWLNAA